ncbi:hypothetical protein MNBD_CPR01-596 [hydrothermal vent metagenome]|uniref:Cadherin-like beta sandwich domain-containing protein n=1 Tax=hydrothermal vent metagenome TaxID=652676 RepID=A0A3B0UVF0_9ZZZZ
MQRLVLTVLFISLFVFIVPAKSSAQINSGAIARADPMSITLSPSSPAPYESFTFSVFSTTIDLSKSTFSVFLNGIKIATGSGNKTISIKATGSGTTMHISVYINFEGETYVKRIIVHPLGLALVTEPLSSAPTLYKGKAGVAPSGEVRVVAVPDFRTANGTYLNPNNLSYVWRDVGTQNRILDSGIGHSSIIVSAPLLYRTKTISVLVQDPSSKYISSRSIKITTDTPSVYIYADDPLMGILYSHALVDAYQISNSDASFVAVPYGFTKSNTAPLITWFLNGSKMQTGAHITVRPEGSGEGVETLSASVKAPQTYSSASSQFKILFGSDKSGSWLFGL